jgi:hypothetical protein
MAVADRGWLVDCDHDGRSDRAAHGEAANGSAGGSSGRALSSPEREWTYLARILDRCPVLRAATSSSATSRVAAPAPRPASDIWIAMRWTPACLSSKRSPPACFGLWLRPPADNHPGQRQGALEDLICRGSRGQGCRAKLQPTLTPRLTRHLASPSPEGSRICDRPERHVP